MEEAEKIVDLVWRMVFGENYIDYEQFRLLEKSKDPKAMGIYIWRFPEAHRERS